MTAIRIFCALTGTALLLATCTTHDTHSTATVSSASADSVVNDSTDINEEVIRQAARWREETAAQAIAAADTIVHIHFPELIVRLSPLQISEEDRQAVSQLQRDSLVLDAGSYDYSDGSLRLHVAPDQLTNVQVAERVGIALYINPVDHEEVSAPVESTRQYSPWRPLQYNSRQGFISGVYRRTDLLRYTGLSLRQIKRIIKQDSDSLDYALVRNKRSLEEAADVLSVIIETYQFRITGRRKDTGQLVTKRIIVYVQIGC